MKQFASIFCNVSFAGQYIYHLKITYMPVKSGCKVSTRFVVDENVFNDTRYIVCSVNKLQKVTMSVIGTILKTEAGVMSIGSCKLKKIKYRGLLRMIGSRTISVITGLIENTVRVESHRTIFV